MNRKYITVISYLYNIQRIGRDNECENDSMFLCIEVQKYLSFIYIYIFIVDHDFKWFSSISS